MMKRIEVLDKAAEVGTKYCDINVNPRLMKKEVPTELTKAGFQSS